MRSIKKRLAHWRLVLLIGIAAVAIPIAASVYTPEKAAVMGTNEHLYHENGIHNDATDANDNKSRKISDAGKVGHPVGSSVRQPQDDYYERRRQHWEKRLDNRLEHRDEYLDEENGDDNDDDFGDDDIDRRREYYRDRLDEDW